MEISGPLYLIILILALGTASFATVFSWQRKALAGARVFAVNSALSAIYSLCGLLLIFSPTTEVAFLSLRLRVILNILMAATFALFVLDFAGYKHWLSLRRFWIFFVFPVFVIALT